MRMYCMYVHVTHFIYGTMNTVQCFCFLLFSFICDDIAKGHREGRRVVVDNYYSTSASPKANCQNGYHTNN